MGEAECPKKSATYCWKSTEIHPKLQFFFLCLSLKPHKMQMKKDNSKFWNHASLLVFCLIFLFSDQPSKGSGCPFSKAKRKAVKVVKFMAMWLNLYPRTVYVEQNIYYLWIWYFVQLFRHFSICYLWLYPLVLLWVCLGYKL